MDPKTKAFSIVMGRIKELYMEEVLTLTKMPKPAVLRFSENIETTRSRCSLEITEKGRQGLVSVTSVV
jgi:hypothetical protein